MVTPIKAAMSNIKCADVKKLGLSYCDPRIKDCTHVIIDTNLKPQASSLVLCVVASTQALAIKSFRETSKADATIGVVTHWGQWTKL